MIRKLIGRLLRRPLAPTPQMRSHAHRYRGAELGLSRAAMSSAAQRTCEGLHKAGFKAYIVGGGVRDSLLGLQPKDFDVATNATPQEVNRIFRRSRLIGRRFQIVHVLYGREVIEVSTFRAAQVDAETDDHGRVLRDNVWGTLEEDAARRDFSVNALYYDPIADQVLDFHDGVRDMKARVIRMIGDPATRFREDPVRLLRVARFAAKLGFTIEERTRAPMRELAGLISNVPSARLFDEMLKLLLSGHALASLHQLRAEGLQHGLLPLLDLILEQPDGERFISIALAKTDARIAEGRTVSPGFLFATLLWERVNALWIRHRQAGQNPIPALNLAIDEVLDAQAGKLAIQKRFVADMREIWSLQPRFERRNGQAPFRLAEHMRLRAGYDFLLLRVETGEAPAELGQWWTDFIAADGPGRAALVEAAPRSGTSTARKRRRRPRRQSDQGGPTPRPDGASA
ncbi:MAG: polynucleotide adenylyltransferase PcnB [Burkholderiaceae bacterium]|nr:polynucleotide adenylyltransferase PcnB [Burkholderiaceae bacterium]MEB2319184.1 polynucleotide adenylyltransferase PcnB [Pseudomonadota bacterium]